MVKKNNVLKIIGLVVGVILLMLLIIYAVGRSFGFFEYAKKGEITNIITISGISTEVMNPEDDGLNLVNAYPVYDKDGMEGKEFRFKVKNSTKDAIDYSIKVENDEEKQGSSPLLATSNIRYAYKIGNGSYSAAANLGENSNIVLTDTISSRSEKIISIKIWIKSDAGNDIQGKYFFGKLILEGSKSE